MYSILATRRTWQLVNVAISKAKASAAGEHFIFYSHPTPDVDRVSLKCFDLLAMPKVPYELACKSARGFWIEITDDETTP